METRTVVMAGNPNVGKSTLFNALTGMHCHTGNWAGKTVDTAAAAYTYDNIKYSVADIPGTYSLIARSPEEKVACDYIADRAAEGGVIVSVCDATCLERNLYVTLQTLEITRRVVVCVNLSDEAEKKGIRIDALELERMLGVRVVLTSAKNGDGLRELCAAIAAVFDEDEPQRVCGCCGDLSGDAAVRLSDEAKRIYEKTVTLTSPAAMRRDGVIDRVLTHRVWGTLIMALLLCAVLWITIVGANYPSAMLSELLFSFEDALLWLLSPLPEFLRSALVLGVYRTLAWVVGVMFPPMAIFFPLFSLLEDIGYLPRVAFNLDGCFRCAKSCGKQALTMCQGLGCNAVGVVGCRIIESPRERAVAIITNSLVPCNGRFPTLVTLSALFFSVSFAPFFLTAAVMSAIVMTFIVSRILTATLLRGRTSAFALELPAYRVPKIGRVLVGAFCEKTLSVLKRAVIVAAPCGAVIFLLANTVVGGMSLLDHARFFLDAPAAVFGLDGTILLAFILAFPANEIVLPIAIMAYMGDGTLVEAESMDTLYALLVSNGWGVKRAICTAVFVLFHFPCSTTLLTIKKETQSLFYTLCAFAVPTITGLALCAIINLIMP